MVDICYELDKAIYNIRRDNIDLAYNKRRGDSPFTGDELELVIYVTYEVLHKLKREAYPYNFDLRGGLSYRGCRIYIVNNVNDHPDFKVYVR